MVGVGAADRETEYGTRVPSCARVREPAPCHNRSMSSSIRHAGAGDLGILLAHDRHIAADTLAASIAAGRVLVLEESGGLKESGGPGATGEASGAFRGWARWGLFWDEIPFLNMLFVLEDHRGAGAGTALVHRWEEDLRGAHFTQVMTSTQSDERAQHLYRRLGYVDCGVLLLPGEPAELLLRKDL